MSDLVRWFKTLGMDDVELVGGKNASLGEMIQGLSASGVRVPDGFATTAEAYRRFLAQNKLAERIQDRLSGLDIEDVQALAAAGHDIRCWILEATCPDDLEQEIRAAYASLAGENPQLAVAVRSSATAEDLPDASFAGQQETYLNVRGVDAVLSAVKAVFASL